MTLKEIDRLVKKSRFASIGFLDEEGNPGIRKVFSTWHKGLGAHLISTNTSSRHVQALLKNNRACLYFDNCRIFKGVCFTGTVTGIEKSRSFEAIFAVASDKSLSGSASFRL